MALLEVEELRVEFDTDDGTVHAVDGISYTVDAGSSLGIVGESGSGKSVSSLTVMGLSRARNATISGSIRFEGKELLTAPDDDMRRIRGDDIAMIFQDPLSSLHPFYKVGDQIVEAIKAHRDVSKAQARDRAVEMLGLVGIPDPRARLDAYPHEFSGGMRQRAMIAMALVNDPKLLIADEPTTALDVTVQAQILDLLQELQRDFNSAIIIITHDLGVVAEMADEVLVMYAGRAVEVGPTRELLTHPEMPYTWGLLSSVPDVSASTDAQLIPIPGNPPSLLDPPTGCPFHPRCLHRDKVPGDLCRTELPALVTAARAGHTKRCHLANPDQIYEAEVLPEIAPDLVDLIVEDSAATRTENAAPGGAIAPENR